MKISAVRRSISLASACLVGTALSSGIAISLPSSPLIQYDLLPEECESGVFANEGTLNGRSLLRNSTFSTCCNAMGVSTSSYFPKLPTTDILTESTNLQDVLPQIRNGTSLSFWIKPLGEVVGRRRILTIAPNTRIQQQPEEDLDTECDHRGVDLQLSMIGNTTFELVYRTSDGVFQPCARVVWDQEEPPIRQGQLVHMAIVLRDQYQTVHFNGKKVVHQDEAMDDTLEQWNPQSFLQLLWQAPFPGEQASSLPWYGHIYHFSWYPYALDHDEVVRVFAQGMTQTKPQALYQEIVTYEDATVDGLMGTLVELQSYSFDLEAQALIIETLEPMEASNSTTSLVFYYLTRLPQRGTLLAGDGGRLGSMSDGDIIPLPSPPQVRFLPGENECSIFPGSVYASLEFCVARGPDLWNAAGCDSVAQVDFVVEPVNDPPQAIVDKEKLPYVVHEGIVEEPVGIRLSGIDIDEGDSIVAVQISTPPTSGDLFLSVGSFRQDNLFHGTWIADLPTSTIPGSEAYVEYRFREGLHRTVQGLAVMDSFRFRVQDSHGSWSEEEVVTVQIVCTLIAVPFSDRLMVAEGESISIPLVGKDLSGLDRPIGFLFETVPGTELGILSDANQPQVKLEQWSRLYGSKQDVYGSHKNGVGAIFSPNDDVVCSSRSSAAVTFSYRVFAARADGGFASVSPVANMTIHIKCRPRPLLLSAPDERYAIEAFEGSGDDPCIGYNFDPNTTRSDDCPSVGIFGGIQVSSDPTNSFDQAMVVVEASSEDCLLTINRNHRSRIQPVVNHEVMRPRIAFSVPTDILSEVLDQLHFQSELPGEYEIQVSVLYGICPQSALSTIRINSTTSPDPNCHISQVMLRVDVSPSTTPPRMHIFQSFPGLPFSFATTMILLLKLKGKAREILARPAANDDDKQDSEESECTEGSDPVPRWKQFYDHESGHYYYQNLEDGTVTWDVPLEEEFVPSKSGDDGSIEGPQRASLSPVRES